MHTPQIISRFGLDGVDIPRDQLNTVIHEVMHMMFSLPVTEESKVVAISEVIQARTQPKLALLVSAV